MEKIKIKDKEKQFRERVNCGIAYCEDTAVDEIKQDFKMQEEKHKQIEEMAKDLGIAFQLSGTTSFVKVAEILVEKYQPKIPEDSVVLSREEFNIIDHNIKHLESVCNNLEKERNNLERNFEYNLVQERKQIRKETVEKYKVAMMLSIQEMQKYLEITEEQAKILYQYNNEIAKQFNIDIKD